MKRIKRLFAELWWLMLIVVGLCIAMVTYVSSFFLVILPMALGFFTYFSFVRYDGQGRDRQT